MWSREVSETSFLGGRTGLKAHYNLPLERPPHEIFLIAVKKKASNSLWVRQTSSSGGRSGLALTFFLQTGAW